MMLPFTVAFLTRVVVDDYITNPMREWVIKKFGSDSKVTYLIHCPRCTATWVSLLVTPAVGVFAGAPIWLWPFLAAATALVAPALLGIATWCENLNELED